MGKWPTLDKIEMVDGPIEEETYERDLRKGWPDRPRG